MMAAEINVAAKFASFSPEFLKFFWIHFIFTIAQSVFKQGFTIHRRMFPQQGNTWVVSSKLPPFALLDVKFNIRSRNVAFVVMSRLSL